MIKLRFSHRLVMIEDVPDNLTIAIGESFTLEVLDPEEGLYHDWFTNSDPVLRETAHPVSHIKTYKAEAVGSSQVQLQVEKNGVTVIERKYNVTVISSEAISATMQNRGTEPLGNEG